MRKRLLLLVAVVVAGTTPALAQVAGVVNTDHDLRTAAGQTAAAQVCITCHTPHNANPARAALLWNRADPTSSYQLYDATVNADFGGGAVSLSAGNAASLLCLSCHDGSIALNATYANGTLSSTNYRSGLLTGSALLGTDLRNDHPIAFAYANTVTAKPGQYVAAGSLTGVKLISGRVECASCHNVHNNTIQPFLRVSNGNSALCLACHL